MIQKILPVGSLKCNCQILVCEQTGESVVIDPGDDAAAIVRELKSVEAHLAQKNTGIKLQVKALFHTHAHFDHIGATRAVKESILASLPSAASAHHEKPPSIYLHRDDEFMYNMLPKQAAMFGHHAEPVLPIDQYFQDGQTLGFGTLKFTVLHTPGHSPGGVCLRMHEDSAHSVAETVFTGDTLFQESVGRSDLWGGDGELLVKSIRNRLLTLDDDTLAWPGHGPRTTVGHERRANPYL